MNKMPPIVAYRQIQMTRPQMNSFVNVAKAVCKILRCRLCRSLRPVGPSPQDYSFKDPDSSDDYDTSDSD